MAQLNISSIRPFWCDQSDRASGTHTLIEKLLNLRMAHAKQHAIRVARLSLLIAQKIKLGVTDQKNIFVGALLHDIGKINIPEKILYKQAALTSQEWALIHLHPVFGHDILSADPKLAAAADIPYCHHEKWDGSGYPRGLKEDQIPLCVRLFSVVDVWDALISNRSYRKAWPRHDALNYICHLAGIEFDPEIVDIFMKEKIYLCNGADNAADYDFWDMITAVTYPKSNGAEEMA